MSLKEKLFLIITPLVVVTLLILELSDAPYKQGISLIRLFILLISVVYIVAIVDWITKGSENVEVINRGIEEK